MSESSDTILKARLLKLLGLARGGIGGEKVNAQAILNRLLTTHGLTLADLEGETEDLKTTLHFFPYSNAFEMRLLHQAAGAVMNQGRPARFTQGNTKSSGYLLTAPQALELAMRWPLYRAAWKAQQERYFRAFIQANNIFPADAPEGDGSLAGRPAPTPTAQELEDVRAMLALARGIAPVPVRALGAGA